MNGEGAPAPAVAGSRATRLDAPDKVTGRARYASDVQLPGMLHGKIVRSDRPHARIISLDTSAAEALPGVEAVLTAAHASGRFGEIIKDQTVFAVDRVRHVGEPVAAVAAESAEIADLAASLIEVEYEDLPAVFDPIAALEPDAPLVHDDVASYGAPPPLIRWGNVLSQITLNRGDVGAAFAQADRVIEGSYSAHSVHQTPLEPRAVVADIDAAGRLIIHSSTQHPFGVRYQLHEALGIPLSDIRVITETVGGGFGSKLEASLDLYAALLARATRRPVRLVNSREEDFTSGNPRHPMVITLRSALASDGTILGREARVILDAGAYAIGSPLLGGVAAMLAPGPYGIPNIAVEVLSVHTNKMPFGAYRGPTGPQCVFAVETHMDEIARELGIDRVALRLQNAFDDSDFGHSGQPLERVSLKEAITRAAEAIRIDQPSAASDPNMLRGKGLACAWWLTTGGAAGCGVQLNEDGTVVVQLGASEIGTGSVMAGIVQIIAEELRVPLEKIRVVWGDTDATPLDAGAQGSRTLYNAGRAAQAAAQDTRRQLLERAAELLEASEADLDVVDGVVRVRGVPDRGVSYADLMAGQMWATGPVLGRGTFLAGMPPHDADSFQGTVFPSFNAPSFHCHAAEVEVDRETGQTRVIDYVVVQDAGFAVNPTLVEGQMQGGAVQGIGYALTEEIVFEDGRMLNPNLALYKLPTTLEAPHVRTVILEYASAEGPYGAKGVGEPPVILPPGAISCAIADAIGSPVRATPFTPEQVRRVIRDGEAAGARELPESFDRRPQPIRRMAG